MLDRLVQLSGDVVERLLLSVMRLGLFDANPDLKIGVRHVAVDRATTR